MAREIGIPYVDLDLPYQVLLIIALGFALFVLFLALRRVHEEFRGAGFTGVEATLILLVAPVLGLVNVPLYGTGNLLLAVNLGGAVVPLFVSVKLVLEKRAPRLRTLAATGLVTIAAFAASSFVPGQGVRIFLWGPIALAVLLGFAFSLGSLRQAAPITYASGSIGILVGADLLRLDEILAWQPPEQSVAAIGGAGALDAVFLVGAIAVGLHLVLFGASRKRRRSR